MPATLMPIALPAHILIIAYVMLRSPSPEIRAARWRGLKDGWRERKTWLQERRAMPQWTNISAFSWSPLALSRRSLKAVAIVGRKD